MLKLYTLTILFINYHKNSDFLAFVVLLVVHTIHFLGLQNQANGFKQSQFIELTLSLIFPLPAKCEQKRGER